METKEERYKMLCSQIGELIAGEHNEMGVLANVSAAMYEAFADRYFWVGFYLVRDGELPAWPVSRSCGLLSYQTRARCVRNGLGKGADGHCSRCRTVSGAYRLQQSVAVWNCGSDVQPPSWSVRCDWYRQYRYRCIWCCRRSVFGTIGPNCGWVVVWLISVGIVKNLDKELHNCKLISKFVHHCN